MALAATRSLNVTIFSRDPAFLLTSLALDFGSCREMREGWGRSTTQGEVLGWVEQRASSWIQSLVSATLKPFNRSAVPGLCEAQGRGQWGWDPGRRTG